MSANEGLCQSCNNPLSPWFQIPLDWRNVKAPTKYELWWCRTCEQGTQHPRPKSDDISAFYEVPDYVPHQNPDALLPQPLLNPPFLLKLFFHLHWRIGTKISHIEWMQPFLPNGFRGLKVCDVGCGGGCNLRILRDLGASTVGIEPDEQVVKKAQSDGFEVFHGGAEECSKIVGQRQFDMVFLHHVLEHTLEPEIALNAIFKILKPGGFLYCNVPNNDCTALRIYGKSWTELDIPRHLNFYTHKSLSSILQKSHFLIKASEYFGSCRQFTTIRLLNQQHIDRVFTHSNAVYSGVLGLKHLALSMLHAIVTLPLGPSRRHDSIAILAQKPAE